MPSNPLDDIIPSAVAVHSRATDYLGVQTVLLRLIVQAIMTAIVTGLFTVTYDATAVTTANSKDLQWIIERLREAGYTVVLDDTDVIISW